MKKPKVYCSKCKHFVMHFGEDCEAPGNMLDDYCWPSSRRALKPSQRNAANKCKLFEPKSE